MASVYKIHPSIGFMRVGDSDNAFYVGPERRGSLGVELGGGAETPVTSYKSGGKIKRQAARFRVWEYDAGPDGKLVPVGEVADYSMVRWTARLVNSKAAGPQIQEQQDGDRTVLVPTGPPRNAAIGDRASLTIDGGRRSITKGDVPQEFDSGSFLGQLVYLGELQVDAAGRLLVLGGRGQSVGVPSAPGGPIPLLNDFANNNRWHDDVSDGPIMASVTIPGKPPVSAVPAWAICSPPDFAPGIGAVVSLYEIAVQAAIDRGWMTAPVSPSFRQDIYPILERSRGIRWANHWQYWTGIIDDWAALASPVNSPARLMAYKTVVKPSLLQFGLPPYVATMLAQWRDGQFVSDWTPAAPAVAAPSELDRIALEACVGANFWPGIDAGFAMTKGGMYMEPFRLSHDVVQPGQMTAAMALPWQADFNDCGDNWWPSQRPNDIFARVPDVPGGPVTWSSGVVTGDSPASRKKMVDNFSKLGFVVEDASGRFLEAERDPTLPPR